MLKSSSGDNGTVKPSRFYQWMLVYPALFVSLIGSVPTVIQEVKAWRLGVATKRVQIVEEQQTLWKSNLDCLRLKPVYTVDLGEGVTVGVTLCGSGDALLRYQRSPEIVEFTWVRYPAYPKGGVPQPSAVDEVLAPQSRVVYGLTHCVLLQSRMILWIQYDDDAAETCHMDYILTTNGALVQRRPVACETCAG